MNRKTVAIILMIVGGAFFLGVVLFVLDRATSTESDGLGTWIFALLGFLLSAATGIKGWLDFNKKETPAPSTTITTGTDSQVATGPNSRQVQVHDGPYVERAEKVEIHYPEKPSLSPLHQLPQPPADFTGREEIISQLLDDFKTHKGSTISGLTGMGGVGKTALGLVVAHEVAKDYPDAQIYLDLLGTTNTPLSAADIMRQVILSFESKMDLRALDEKGIADAYYSILHNKKALLFLDNARSANQIKPLIPPETCVLLVTSRWTFPVTGLKNHPLDVMKIEDAKAFLLELCPRIGEHAAGLAKDCGYLPLALRIAGSFLQVNDNWPVDDYLKQLNDRKGRLETFKESHKEAELKTEPDLLAAFELSYNQLQEQEQERWRMLGVFPTSFAMNAAGAIWELEENETRKSLSLYGRYSLLDYDETSARYSLHDLLAEYAWSQIDQEEEVTARINHAVHYANVLHSIAGMFSQGGGNILPALRMYDTEWTNIETGQKNSVLYAEENKKATQASNRYAWQGFINNLRLIPKDYMKWLEDGIRASKLLKNKNAEAGHLGNLGNVYANLGETRKAIEYYEQQLVIVREIGDRRGEGNPLGNLGIAYADLGETRKAIEYYEQQLGITREIGDRRGEGNALGNLGIAYKNLGDARKAIEFYEQQLVIAHEIGDRRGEGAALGNLGVAYSDLGEVRKAIEYYEQHLVIAREIGDRTGEGNALYNMGLALYGLEEKDRAIDLVRQALAVYEAIESPHAEGARNKLKEWGALPADPPT